MGNSKNLNSVILGLELWFWAFFVESEASRFASEHVSTIKIVISRPECVERMINRCLYYQNDQDLFS